MATHIGVLPLGAMNILNSVPDGDPCNSQPALRFLKLPHPRTGLPCLFLPYKTSPNGGETFLEVQTVSSSESRSWFIEDNEVVADGKLLLMAPIDPTFLLVPIAEAAFASNSTSNFRTFDDILESASAAFNAPLEGETEDATATILPQDVMALGEMDCTQRCMKKICEYKDITPDLTVYRFSRPKLIEYLLKKVTRLCEGDIVAKSRALTRELAKDGLMDDRKDELLKTGRIKMTCDLVSQYVSTDVYAELLSKHDFVGLNDYLCSMKEEALSVAVAESTNVKKAKTDSAGQDSKKRKAVVQASKGVEKLKKANVKGMAKLSTFFKKPAVEP